MNATDTDFYRAFAARVRTQLATTTREGDPTMSTDIAETTQAAAPAPATPHEQHPWCVSTRSHDVCMGPELGLPAPEFNDPGRPVPSILSGYLEYDSEDDWTGIVYDRGSDNPVRLDSGDELRAETARVRAHLARLDALADQFDAIREAGDSGQQTAAGGHFPWCGDCATHHAPEGDWTEHESEWNNLPNRGRHSGRTAPLLKSALYFSDELLGAPELGVTFLDDGRSYTGPEADDLIADLEAFTARLKAQRARLDEKPAAR